MVILLFSFFFSQQLFLTVLILLEDFIILLTRCKEALRENGLIIIKDNIRSASGFVVDKEDSSVTR